MVILPILGKLKLFTVG